MRSVLISNVKMSRSQVIMDPSRKFKMLHKAIC